MPEVLNVEKKKYCGNIEFVLIVVVVICTHPAIADPGGIEIGFIGVTDGFIITVPSTNGANPGRNLR
jgi:hypothetical protein